MKRRTQAMLLMFCLAGILTAGCAYFAPKGKSLSQDGGFRGIDDPSVVNENPGAPSRFSQ